MIIIKEQADKSDGQTDGQKDGKTDRHKDKSLTHRQTYGQIDRQNLPDIRSWVTKLFMIILHDIILKFNFKT